MGKRVTPEGVIKTSDGFWGRVVVVTFVVLWLGLLAGHWAGRYAIEQGLFKEKKHWEAAETRNNTGPELVEKPSFRPGSQVPPAPNPTRPEMATPSPVPTRRTVIVTPTAPATVEATPSETPSPTPVEETPATSSPAPTTAPAESGNYTLQVGAFSNQVNADTLVEQLKAAGYQPQVIQDGSVIRVHVGHYTSREEALKAEQELRDADFTPVTVPAVR